MISLLPCISLTTPNVDEAGHLVRNEVMLMMPSGGWYDSVGSIPYVKGYKTLTANATQTKMSES